MSSQAVALAPCSQNSAGCGSAGLAHEQLTQAKPSGLFCLSRMRVPSSRMCASLERVRHLLDGRPAAGGVRERFDADVFVLGHGGVSREGDTAGRQGACRRVVRSGRCKTGAIVRQSALCARAVRARAALPGADLWTTRPISAAPAPGQQPDPNRAYQMFPMLDAAPT